MNRFIFQFYLLAGATVESGLRKIGDTKLACHAREKSGAPACFLKLSLVSENFLKLSLVSENFLKLSLVSVVLLKLSLVSVVLLKLSLVSEYFLKLFLKLRTYI